MKALKIILFVVVALVALFLILGIVAPKDARVERSIEINAPIELVYAHVSNLKNMDNWSPWSKLDSNMLRTYAGNDGEVGSIAEWESDNEKVGKGKQEIILLEENKRVETKLTFFEPWEAESDAYVELDAGENGVTVTWGFYSTYAYPMNAMMIFMNMDEMLGPDYEEGLSMLKNLVEQEYAATKFMYDYDIQEVELPLRTYITTRDTVNWPDMQQFFATNFTKTFASLGKKGIQPMSSPTGLYYNWDTENKSADMSAGVAVEKGKMIAGYTMVDIGGKALKIAYKGPYSGTEEAHKALGAYLEKNGLTFIEPAIEEYVTDPEAEPDSTQWLTNIYYLIKS